MGGGRSSEKKGLVWCDMAVREYTHTHTLHVRERGVGVFMGGWWGVSGTTLHPQIIDSSWPSPRQNKPGSTKKSGLLF